MIVFEKIKYKNILSTGNDGIEIELNKHRNTSISGKNGSGKCCEINTPITLRNTKTGEVFVTTIGELYEEQNKQANL